MTPRARDRGIVRVRHLTGVIAGLSVAACGLFVGLAATAKNNVLATVTHKTIVRTTTVTKTTPAVSSTSSTSSKRSTKASTPVVVVTQSAPIATSGGS
jgi:hypothetical protein